MIAFQDELMVPDNLLPAQILQFLLCCRPVTEEEKDERLQAWSLLPLTMLRKDALRGRTNQSSSLPDHS